MSLTVTEKEHWKERVNARISKRIEQIWNDHRDVKMELETQAEREILEKFKIKDKWDELIAAKDDRAALNDRIVHLEQEIIAKLGRHIGYVTSYSWENQLKSEILKMQQRLMRDTEPGRRVAALEEEKENSLDAVWLATSSRQIRELWSKVGDLLGDASTSVLTQSALTIEPGDE
jgi:hypothetical protein